MTSLFERMELTGTPLPVDLLSHSGRAVSLLEFFAVDSVTTPAPVQAAEPTPESGFVVEQRAAQLAAMIDAAREDAARDTRRALEAEFAAALEAERLRVREVCAAFAHDRQRYFAAAETQVVRLALAVARRVLAHETAGEGMHLLPTVRAALARVHDGSASTLRVEPAAVEAWRALLTELAVEVRADERIQPGECVLETGVGRVELGVRAQMDEIERGFGELMEHA